VTWYANECVNVKGNALRTVSEEDIVVAGERHDPEDAPLAPLQVMFGGGSIPQ
jgi:hypothetical protein